MIDPWMLAHQIPGLTVSIVRLPDRVTGATRGRTIFLDDRLSERELRCILTHELVHLEMGHEGHQPPPVEREVRLRTAEALISEAMLKNTLAWTKCPHEAAEELHVTVPVLRDRLELHHSHNWRTS